MNSNEAFLNADGRREALEAELSGVRYRHADAVRRLGRRYTATAVCRARIRHMEQLEFAISECEVIMFGVL